MAESYDKGGDLYSPNRSQNFEVLMIKKGKHIHLAVPDDLVRVPVSASSIGSALEHPDVVAKDGYVPVQAAAPGISTPYENEARRRAHDAVSSTVDRSKL